MDNALSFSPSLFKAYDIRGTFPDLLNTHFAYELGLALAARARARGIMTVVVGRDGRLSSPNLSEALQQGLNEGGIDTYDLGQVPTPLVYFGAHKIPNGSGIAITGSHNPPEYNGFKMMMGGQGLYGESIQALRHEMGSIAEQPLVGIPAGTTQTIDIVTPYIQDVVSRVHLQRPMKVAIDCGNGVAGAVAPELFRALGCEVTELFCEVDGKFPNHHPDPANPANLQALIQHLQSSDCEIGLAFDGDGDRLGVVTKSGQIIWPDRQLILYAREVLSRNPGATIIYDVKCSRHVSKAVEQAGGVPLMSQTGHSLIKAKLAETGALLAGEMSGHIFFKDRWYGFDDGLYTGARLLEILSYCSTSQRVSWQLENLPQAAISTPELNLAMQEGEPYALIQALQNQALQKNSDQFKGATAIITIDGVRVEYKDGFGLARASNTTPVIVFRFEAESAEALARIQNDFRTQLLALKPGLNFPF